jgi:hypothetical protein
MGSLVVMLIVHIVESREDQVRMSHRFRRKGWEKLAAPAESAAR